MINTKLPKGLFPIEDYKGLYSVTRDGKVWSHSRSKNIRINRKTKKPYLGKWLRSFKNGDGYLCINLCKNKKLANRRIHRLVAQVYIANEGNKPYINHKNMNKTDNRVENLEWCTALENVLHSKANGNYALKLTKEQVYLIRANHIPKESSKNKAWIEYGVSASTYYKALNKKYSYFNV